VLEATEASVELVVRNAGGEQGQTVEQPVDGREAQVGALALLQQDSVEACSKHSSAEVRDRPSLGGREHRQNAANHGVRALEQIGGGNERPVSGEIDPGVVGRVELASEVLGDVAE
jgi:hypothetical protein